MRWDLALCLPRFPKPGLRALSWRLPPPPLLITPGKTLRGSWIFTFFSRDAVKLFSATRKSPRGKKANKMLPH